MWKLEHSQERITLTIVEELRIKTITSYVQLYFIEEKFIIEMSGESLLAPTIHRTVLDLKTSDIFPTKIMKY